MVLMAHTEIKASIPISGSLIKKRRGSQVVNGGGLKHKFMRIKQSAHVVISALLVGSGVQIPSPASMRNK